MNRFRLLLSAAALLLCSASLSACSRPARDATPNRTASSQATFHAADGTREAALRALDSLRRSAFQDAFANLDRYDFTRRVRTEQLDAEGRATASETHVARYPAGGGPAEEVRSDSSGAFDFGWLGPFSSAEDQARPPSDLGRHLLPEEPAFLSERNEYAFQYRLLPDTSLRGRPARVVALRARPDEGDDQPLRSARLYLDRATDQLVAARFYRVRHSIFFDEDTRLFLRLRPAPPSPAQPAERTWVPAQTRFQTHLHMPLHPERRFRAAATYTRYRRPT